MVGVKLLGVGFLVCRLGGGRRPAAESCGEIRRPSARAVLRQARAAAGPSPRKASTIVARQRGDEGVDAGKKNNFRSEGLWGLPQG